jgi:hypothetical protein
MSRTCQTCGCPLAFDNDNNLCSPCNRERLRREDVGVVDDLSSASLRSDSEAH